MPSSDLFSFIEDFSSIKNADKDYLQRTLKKYPYFSTAALFLARSNPSQEAVQHAALRTADRKILRYWLDDAYRAQLEIENTPKVIPTSTDTVLSGVDIHTEEVNAFEKLEQKVENKTKIEEEQAPILVEESFFEEPIIIETSKDTEETTNFFEEIEDEVTPVVLAREPVDTFVPPNTTDSNFFEQVEKAEDDVEEINENISKNLTTADTFIPSTTTDATFESNFFDEVDEEQNDPFYTKETESIDNKIDAFVSSTTTDANFFEEIESDDSIFEAAEKDLASYEFLEEETKDSGTPTNDTLPDAENDSSFFDDI